MTLSIKQMNAINTAAQISDLDESCLLLQMFLGVEDGGVAGIYFSGGKGDNWSTMSVMDRIVELENYVDLENSYAERAAQS